MLKVEELMNKLNEKGKITDKETAIELLMVSPKAWDLLSPELKKDEEVILYYQPQRYVETEGGPTFGAYEPSYAAVECDKRFKMDAKVHVGCFADVNIISMMPKFVLRKSNRFKKAYLNVQKRLKYELTLSGDMECHDQTKEEYKKITKNMEGIYREAEYPYVGQTDGYHNYFAVYETDLSVLPEIVEDEYKQYLKEKRR